MRFFHVILWQPLFNILVVFYLLTGNLGIAIILLTLFVRFLLYSVQDKASKSQMEMQLLQPELEEIKNKYKDNKEEQGKQMMDLYKKHKINPFSSFVVMLIQLPVFISVYNIFKTGINTESLKYVYSFIPMPGEINNLFLGLNLSEPSPIIAVLVGVTFFFQMKFATIDQPKTKKKGFGDMFQKQMVYMFPILFGFIMLQLPSALGIYLITGAIFLTVQQHFTKKKYSLQKNV